MELQQTETPPSQENLNPAPQPQGDQLPTIAELEKMDKFKFDGQEWTAKDLRDAILRQKDYTKKTQEVAQTRKQYETEKETYNKLRSNYLADMRIVRNNQHRPEVISEFMKHYGSYPEFVERLKEDLHNSQGQQGQQQTQQAQPAIDFDTANRLATLERFYHDQEVAKNETQINTTIDRLTTKYPDAIPEMAIGRVFEAYTQLLKNDPNAKLSSEMWEDTFKTVDQFMKDRVATMYKSKQQEQLKANKRAGDVSTGGGTPGRAPQKFKRLKDVAAFAERDLTGRN